MDFELWLFTHITKDHKFVSIMDNEEAMMAVSEFVANHSLEEALQCCDEEYNYIDLGGGYSTTTGQIKWMYNMVSKYMNKN